MTSHPSPTNFHILMLKSDAVSHTMKIFISVMGYPLRGECMEKQTRLANRLANNDNKSRACQCQQVTAMTVEWVVKDIRPVNQEVPPSMQHFHPQRTSRSPDICGMFCLTTDHCWLVCLVERFFGLMSSRDWPVLALCDWCEHTPMAPHWLQPPPMARPYMACHYAQWNSRSPILWPEAHGPMCASVPVTYTVSATAFCTTHWPGAIFVMNPVLPTSPVHKHRLPLSSWV